jgi:hypothetical protein
MPTTLQISTSVIACSHTCKHSRIFHCSSFIFLALRKVYGLLQFYLTHLPVRYLAEWVFGRLRPTYLGIQWVRFLAGARPALVPSQSPIRWVGVQIPRWVSGQFVQLTTHLHLVPRLRISRPTPPLPLHLYDVHRDNFTFTSMHCSVSSRAW